MKNFSSSVRSLVKGAALVATTLFLFDCSEEKTEPLPDLPAIELPKELPGLYSGRMPCDDCKVKMIRLTLNEDMSAEVVQTRVQDTLITDTLKGSYVVTDSTVKVSLSDNSIGWNYKRGASGTLSYITSAGTLYEDENGMHADLIRIFKAPVTVKENPAAKETKE